MLTPGPEKGEMHATLHGELSLILGWIGAKNPPSPKQKKTPEAFASGVMLSMGAGTGFEPVTFRL